jgi:hypothetical protein
MTLNPHIQSDYAQLFESIKSGAPKLLHLVYEGGKNASDLDFDSRTAFRELTEDGLLSSVITFPYYADWLQHQDASVTQKKIIEHVRNEKPDIIFWHHIKQFPVTDEFFNELRAQHPKVCLVYHEGDPYARNIKKITPSMKVLIRHADLIFWVGLGHLREFAIENGGKRVYLAPHVFDTERFWTPWEPTLKREFDITMIASSGKARLPFRYLPGGRNRQKCVDVLTKNFGNRFALYGHGWKPSVSYRGPVPFAEQHKAIRNSWISANWDHFDDINFYASNRLPISMAAGVPHITTYHKGFDYLYKTVPGGLYFANSPSEVADIACYLLSKPVEELVDEGKKASEYAYAHLRASVVYKNMLKKISEFIASR